MHAGDHTRFSNGRPLRVGLVAGEFRPGLCGVADYTLRLASALREAGVEVVVATTTASLAVARSQSDAVPVVAVADDWHRIGVRRAAGILRDMRLDVVHLQLARAAFSYGGEIAALPRLLAGAAPVVVTAHQTAGWSPPSRRPPSWLARLALGREPGAILDDRDAGRVASWASAVILTDPAQVAGFWRVVPAVRGSLHYVPVGSSVPPQAAPRAPAREKLRRALGVDDSSPVVLWLAGPQPGAALEALLAGGQRLRRSRPGARLLAVGSSRAAVCGRDGRRDALRVATAAARLGIDDLVRPLVATGDDEFSEVLHAADVGVAGAAEPSLRNGVLLAALAHGLPLVAAGGGRPDPVLTEAGAVHLAAGGDAAALVAATEEVLDRPFLARGLAQRGRRLVRAHVWPLIAASHLEIYGDLARPAADTVAAPRGGEAADVAAPTSHSALPNGDAVVFPSHQEGQPHLQQRREATRRPSPGRLVCDGRIMRQTLCHNYMESPFY